MRTLRQIQLDTNSPEVSPYWQRGVTGLRVHRWKRTEKKDARWHQLAAMLRASTV